MILERNNLLKKARKSQRMENNVKKDYFKTQVAENRNNPKKLWKLIKNLTKDGTNKHNLINLLIDKEGNQYSDDQQMAHLINIFYVNQPRDLLDSISSMSPDVHPCTTDSACSTPKVNPLVIPHISEAQIENAIIRLMPMHKVAGADSLSAKILKISACAISSPLAGIINYCIDNSCFLSAWKLAEVISIYKDKGSKSDMNNYRPISLLPLLSKIFERHIHTAMYKPLNGNNLYITSIWISQDLLDRNNPY